MARSALRRHRRIPAALLAAGLGTALVGLAGVLTHDAAGAAPACRIEFSSSDERPAVGQNITLSWSSQGADQLLASWTTADVPAQGRQVTTKKSPGAVSYQVTGLNNGQYCGGASVNVVFVSASQATTSSAPAPTTSAPATSTPAKTSSSASSASRTAAATNAAPTTSDVSYPAQSATGGSGLPWYSDPANLAILGALSLVGSLALFNRDRVRAVVVRRH